MATLVQLKGNNIDDKWFSNLGHFKREGNMFVLEEVLYGYKRTIKDGGVYKPHVIDVIKKNES
ncbi:hypothetical protein [Rhabdochromatium marinum]|uniref:hypothetical protein n=1 Tax=Rhabdochromatium marinum TaxID=48729 RepID=UPI001908B25F|nr:hypothetical protein [Rhabdochromatium marinum]